MVTHRLPQTSICFINANNTREAGEYAPLRGWSLGVRTVGSWRTPKLYGSMRLKSDCVGLSVVIPALDPDTGYHIAPMKYPEAYEKVKEYLKTLLQNTFEQIKDYPDEVGHYGVLMKLGVAGAALELKQQLKPYWKKEWPFAQKSKPVEDHLV
ncbi:hypothetical protein C0989_011243 [Termitomyces sp. Mn162]|nr:hypothetical protein C0989_011243 [Termitomyces sp. Mn162]KAH0583093.1 hypothetical protein H2248_010979 [Termitomyces sp. 'cryptogamus']